MMREQSHYPAAQIQLQMRLPLAWLGVLFLLAFALPDRIWNTLLIGVGGMFLLAYIWVRVLAAGLFATRKLRFGWVSVGDRLEELFTLQNDGPLPALWVEIIDYANVPGYKTAVIRSVNPRSKIQWRETAVCQQRGQYQLGPWTIRSSDPFGLFLVTRHYPSADDIIIHPPIHTGIPIPLPSGESDGRIRTRQRALQATINAATVRPHHPQDPMRWIHWPSSAKRNQLFVRQFDLDAAGDIWILLDLQASMQLGEGVTGTEEHAVLLAASLSARALRQNRPVGLAIYGQAPQILPPQRGMAQQWRILRTLALVEGDVGISLAEGIADLGRLVRRETAVIIITPSAELNWIPELAALRQRGVQSNLILLDRPSFSGSGNSKATQEAVRHLGISCHILRQGEIGNAPEAGHRHGFWKFITTATGHVVAVENPFNA